ncbi:MAG: GNAT family N-acetyltransferase [Cyanobacteria bacterium QS_8_64_29]|nr:MAG: GNAT family N-acetyltransferase [Cyanobacteria bacterium QS_8_64_29]
MAVSRFEDPPTAIRPVQYRDLGAIEALLDRAVSAEGGDGRATPEPWLRQKQRWLRVLPVLRWLPPAAQRDWRAYVAERAGQIAGFIKVSPANKARSTWQIDCLLADAAASRQTVGSQLIRHCLEAIGEARTWLLEVNISDRDTLALYRQNGFQPLAQMTDWAIPPQSLAQLAQREPQLPNLLPVNNVDAQLLYQLDTAAMPPLLRQAFDRHVRDFKTGPWEAAAQQLQQWWHASHRLQGYVFEPQRKAAIGYLQLQVARDGEQAADLTVHPAYTWLYPELLAYMARAARPAQVLQLRSADYQPEREAYLAQIGAQQTEQTLLMSRSVWHKLREAKANSLARLQLSEVLQGLQPGGGTPVPGRMVGANRKRPTERELAAIAAQPADSLPPR